MKKALSLLLTLTLLFSLSLTAAASSGTVSADITYRDIKLVVNGQDVIPTDANGERVEPFIMGGTTYLPVRAVAGALGLSVAWDGATSTVTLTTGAEPAYGSGTPELSLLETQRVSITYRDIKLVIDGQAVTPTDAAGNPVEPFILDGTTYLPVRAVADALGLEVSWDGTTSTVTLRGDVAPRVLILPSKCVTQSSYSAEGLSISATSTETYAYDARGNITSYSLQGPGSNCTITYTYDSRDNVTSYRYESTGSYAYTVSTFNTYDESDNLIRQETSGTMGSSVLLCRYDGEGNLLRTEYNGDSLSYVYDYTYQAGLLVKTVYTEDGQLSSTTLYRYDSAGRCLSVEVTESGGDGYTYAYTYDSAGNVLTETFTSANSSYTYTYTYDAQGNILTESTRSGDFSSQYTYTYDGRGNMLTLRHTDSSGEDTLCTYTYDSQDRITSLRCEDRQDASRSYTEILEYDSHGQMVLDEYRYADGSTSRSTFSYTYDSHGNILHQETDIDGFLSVTDYEYITLTLSE